MTLRLTPYSMSSASASIAARKNTSPGRNSTTNSGVDSNWSSRTSNSGSRCAAELAARGQPESSCAWPRPAASSAARYAVSGTFESIDDVLLARKFDHHVRTPRALVDR